MITVRILDYVAEFDGSVDDVLAAQGVSSTVRTGLRKRSGLVCRLSEEREIPLRLIDRLTQGEKVRIRLEDDVKPIPKWDVPVDIVYEDEDIAVVDKSAGIAVIPRKNHYGRSLANALAVIWGDFVYRPVNRLDRDTSGLMIVAKNRLAHGILATSHIYREYIALCDGTYTGARSGIVDKPIARVGKGMKREVSQQGDRAITHYEFIGQYDGYFSCKYVLETGRTHQIRVHSADMGYPLCCDRLYNPKCRSIICPDGSRLDRQALHSCRISFVHPIDGRSMEFRSSPPFLKDL